MMPTITKKQILVIDLTASNPRISLRHCPHAKRPFVERKPSPIVTQAKAGVQEALSSLILAFAWVAKGAFRPFFQDPDPVEQFSHFTATRL
jgi:hypothetical protein